MAENTLKARMIQKHATKAEWALSSFVPKKGELILEDDTKRIKIGDGLTQAKNLVYIDDPFGDVKTIKANLVNFFDNEGGNDFRELKIILPYNSNGYTSSVLTRTGKNLLDDSKRYFSAGSISFGTTTSNNQSIKELPIGIYTFSTTEKDHFPNLYVSQMASSSTIDVAWAYNKKTLVFKTPIKGIFKLYSYNGFFKNEYELGPTWVEVGNQSTSYEPYIGQEYELSFDKIYGGEIDILNGQIINKYNSDGTLKTELDVQNIDPPKIKTLTGTNNLWVNNGTLEVAYKDNEYKSYNSFPLVNIKDNFIQIDKGANNVPLKDIQIELPFESYNTSKKYRLVISGKNLIGSKVEFKDTDNWKAEVFPAKLGYPDPCHTDNPLEDEVHRARYGYLLDGIKYKDGRKYTIAFSFDNSFPEYLYLCSFKDNEEPYKINEVLSANKMFTTDVLSANKYTFQPEEGYTYFLRTNKNQVSKIRQVEINQANDINISPYALDYVSTGYYRKEYEIDLSNFNFYGGIWYPLLGKVQSTMDSNGSLITPTLIDVDPIEATTLYGINNLWCDQLITINKNENENHGAWNYSYWGGSCNINLTYRVDPTLALDELKQVIISLGGNV